MSVGSLFNTSTSALRAAYAQLQTTGHNIANVNTPGYTRQEVILSTANATGTSGGFIGRGVDIAGVERRYDQFLTAEVVSGTAAVAADKTRAEQIGRLERMLADTDNGIGVAIDDLYAFALPRLKTIQQAVNVHFTRAGSEALAGRSVERPLLAKPVGRLLHDRRPRAARRAGRPPRRGGHSPL